MKKFKLNKLYNHKADKVYEAFHLDEKRADELVDKVGTYWDSLTEESFMISKILDFIEQQDWTTIEKLYATERFTAIYQDEATFGYIDEDLLDYIISEWKKKETISDEEETREYLKHMFKLLSVYDSNSLIDILKDVNILSAKFAEINPEEHHEEDIHMTPEQIEIHKNELSLNSVIQNVDKGFPDSIGLVIFNKDGYIVTGKTPEATKILQDVIMSGQKRFVSEHEQNKNMYQ